jgi:hypothetical protein
MVLFCFVLTFATGVAYILANANHLHDRTGPHSDCRTCVNINAVLTVMKSMTILALGVAILKSRLLAHPSNLFQGADKAQFFTPVTLKVRLNN